MIFDILTLFPEMFASPFAASIIGKAADRGLLRIRIHNIRDYAEGRHKVTDDRPFGGGEGMVMKPEPVMCALDALTREPPPARVVLLNPQGRPLDQQGVHRLSRFPRLILICGRYEGVDERVAKCGADDEISIGDYILTGGELAAMIVVDAVARLIPGVLGNSASVEHESFREPLLECPHYTRPRRFRGHDVPEVLLSGDHQRIERWRRAQSLLRTRERRPDLFARLKLSAEDMELLRQVDTEPAERFGEDQI